MSKERAHLDLSDDLDLSGFTPKKPRKDKPDMDAVALVAEKSGFTSREPKRRPRRQRSPYQTQLNLKCREGIKTLFQDLGDRLDVHDHTTFERALLALIEKEGYADLLGRYRDVTQ